MDFYKNSSPERPVVWPQLRGAKTPQKKTQNPPTPVQKPAQKGTSQKQLVVVKKVQTGGFALHGAEID